MNTPTETSPPTSGPGTQWLTAPNLLSALRLASVPLFLWLFLSGREEAAVMVFGAAAATDYLDGYVARRTGAITELGKLLDPLADRAAIVALVVVLVARSAMPWWLAAAVVARDVLVLGAFPFLERRGLARIPVNVVGKWATASLLAGLTLLVLSETGFAIARYGRAPGIALTVVGAVLYWAAGALYARVVVEKLRGDREGKTGDRLGDREGKN